MSLTNPRQCLERTRLAEEVRSATKELQWLIQEEFKMVASAPGELETFRAVKLDGEERWRSAIAALHKHVEEHGCAPPTEKRPEKPFRSE